jgi:hypothetical protein
MLAFFRHHRGAFLIVLTVIIIISFSVWGGWTRAGSGGVASPTDIAFTMYGRDYTTAELNRSQRLFELARSIGLTTFGFELIMVDYQYETRDSSPIDFTFNLMVLQKMMDEYGIHPSDSEAIEAMRNLSAFQKEGKFDEAQAAMMENNLGMFGFRTTDLLDLVKYEIALRKIKSLVTDAYVPSDFMVGRRYATMYQTIQASTATFKLDDFKKDAKIEDSEIEQAYQDKLDTFKTAEKRSARWILMPAPADLDKIEDADERSKKTADHIEQVRQFADSTHNPDAKLEELAKEKELKVETTEFFAQDSPPEALAELTTVVNAIFRLDPEVSTITDPIQTEKGFYFAELVSTEEPKQQELAEVKDQIKEQLIEQKAREAMSTAVNDTREQLAAGLKEGKKLEDLAKEKKLELIAVPEFSPSVPPADVPNAFEIAKELESTPINGVTKPITTNEGDLLIAIVTHKELRKKQEGDTTRDGVASSLGTTEKERIFKAWFAKQKEAAKINLRLRVG